MSTGGPGVAFSAGGRVYFLPVERLAFVAPIRETIEEHLVLARGRVPLLPLADRLGLPSREDETSAIGIDGRRGFYAIKAADVRWVEGAEATNLEAIEPDGLWTPEEERRLFSQEAGGV
ncbi:MAG: hypothetical protein ACRD16_07345 [Thermoanaerobaculia bacterium]